MRFGEKIRILRTQRGLSQEQLALELGVSRQAISRWELGEVVPDTANVLRLSQLFGVSTDYLLHENYAGDRDIPAVKTAEFDLQKRQRAVGTGMFCRFGMLAAPALYHSEVRRGGETEMLPFLYVLALVFGIILACHTEKMRRSCKAPFGKLLLMDAAAVSCVCFLPPMLDWVPAGYGLLLSQLAAVPFLQRVWIILRRAYDLPDKAEKRKL